MVRKRHNGLTLGRFLGLGACLLRQKYCGWPKKGTVPLSWHVLQKHKGVPANFLPLQVYKSPPEKPWDFNKQTQAKLTLKLALNPMALRLERKKNGWKTNQTMLGSFSVREIQWLT